MLYLEYMNGIDGEITKQGIRNEPSSSALNYIDDRAKFRIAQEERRRMAIRPETEEVTAERKLIGTKLLESVQQIPDSIPLRFHGAHSYDLEEILSSGAITSGADRVGTMTSFDAKGEISVTTPKTLKTTVGDYQVALEAISRGVDIRKAGSIDIMDKDVPLGVMFLLMPENADEAAIGEHEGNKMHNTVLKDKKMVGLVVSREFKPNATALMEKYGYDNKKCLTYEDFIDKLPEVIDGIKANFPYTETYTPPAPRPTVTISL